MNPNYLKVQWFTVDFEVKEYNMVNNKCVRQVSLARMSNKII